MECPKCGGRTRVMRTTHAEGQVRRVRECDECGTIFRTREVCSRVPPQHEITSGAMVGV